MAETFGVSLATPAEAFDIVARFGARPVEGPMRSEHAQVVASSIGEIAGLDSEANVAYREPVVPIDPISYQPNYAEATLPTVLITTNVHEGVVMSIFPAHEQAVAEAAGRMY